MKSIVPFQLSQPPPLLIITKSLEDSPLRFPQGLDILGQSRLSQLKTLFKDRFMKQGGLLGFRLMLEAVR
jgi:hypothetical protein